MRYCVVLQRVYRCATKAPREHSLAHTVHVEDHKVGAFYYTVLYSSPYLKKWHLLQHGAVVQGVYLQPSIILQNCASKRAVQTTESISREATCHGILTKTSTR